MLPSNLQFVMLAVDSDSEIAPPFASEVVAVSTSQLRNVHASSSISASTARIDPPPSLSSANPLSRVSPLSLSRAPLNTSKYRPPLASSVELH